MLDIDPDAATPPAGENPAPPPCVRVDLRGSGDSDGVMLDECLPQEQEDAVEVIAWLAHQPWCRGKVGMFGTSWEASTASKSPPGGLVSSQP